MPRRTRQKSSQKSTRQQTLLHFLSSSPPSSPVVSLLPKSPSPRPLIRKRTRKIISTSSGEDADSDVGAIHLEPEALEISDEDNSPRRPKKRASLMSAHVIPASTMSDESMEETARPPRRRKGREKKTVLDSEDDRPRKLIKGTRPSTPEDDDDVLDAENQVLESRLRSRGKLTAFQRNLEKLKMLKGKKRGEPVSEPSSEVELSESSVEAPFKGAKPHHSGSSNASNDETDDSGEDDKDFIVDDEHGVPAAQLPLAFSLSAQDLAHHFKIICQLFVHVAVQPLVDRRPFLERALKEEEYLSVPLQVTRRKLGGLRDSLVASSVWKSDFKQVLETYPNLTIAPLTFAIPQCDACNLGGRLSTLIMRLSGKRYDKYDFEDLSDDESEDEDDDKDQDSNSDCEQEVKAEFHVGRFCAARTQVYHRFSHWEYSLYKSLQREIVEAQDGSRRFVKVAYFGGIKPPRDLHDADKMMEWLDERGIIEMEWKKVRQMMDSARTLERGGDMDELTTDSPSSRIW